MDWKPFVTTFTMLLLAELGDKTQLAMITQAAKWKSPWLVWAGGALALVLVSGMGVLLGQVCADCLPKTLIRWLAGIAFIVMGVFTLVRG